MDKANQLRAIENRRKDTLKERMQKLPDDFTINDLYHDLQEVPGSMLTEYDMQIMLDDRMWMEHWIALPRFNTRNANEKYMEVCGLLEMAQKAMWRNDFVALRGYAAELARHTIKLMDYMDDEHYPSGRKSKGDAR
jgi:hypothetical protein